MSVTGRGNSILEYIAPVKNPIGVELGVHKGVLSNYLLSERPDLRLYMVDSWKQFDSAAYRKTRDACAFFTQFQQDQFHAMACNVNEKAIIEGRAIVIQADSLVAVKEFDDASLDFVFIDAEHSYEGCKRDIEAWRSKVKPGGWVCGHDYKNTIYPQFDVTRAVHDALDGAIELGTDFTWFWRVPAHS